MMDVKGVSRREIEAKLATVGDYVKMDYLQSCLKKQLDFDTKKYVLVTLSKIYESRRMFLEAGRLLRISADINTTYDGKINEFLKSAELFIYGGNFVEADVSLSKALASGNDRQKVATKIKIKETYKTYAQDLLKRDKRKLAMETYEKMLTLDLDPIERSSTQSSLLELYNKLGKVKEFFALQKTMGGAGTSTARY